MRCPSCNTDDSYTGLQWVHCVNEDCCYFDPKYVAKLKAERENGSAYEIHLGDKVERLILLRGEIGDSSGQPKSP